MDARSRVDLNQKALPLVRRRGRILPRQRRVHGRTGADFEIKPVGPVQEREIADVKVGDAALADWDLSEGSVVPHPVSWTLEGDIQIAPPLLDRRS